MKSSNRRTSRILISTLIGACALAGTYQVVQWSRHKDVGPTVAAGPQRPSIEPAPAVAVTTDPATGHAKPLIEKPLMAVAPAPAQPAIDLSLVMGPTTQPVAFGAPLQAPSSAQLLGDAKARVSAGDLMPARTLLNQALQSGALSPADTESTKSMLANINATLVFSPKVFSGDPCCIAYSVKPGDKLTKIASDHDITWELLGRLNKLDDPRKLRSGRTIKIINGPFHAVVRKSAFKMDLYLGSPDKSNSTYVTSFGVGLGKDDSTPTGTWEVEAHKKIKNPTYFSPRGEGVIQADDPKNPLGEFWIGLSGIDGQALGKSSYGIHGTIEPESIGKMASMGCIRLRNEDVAQVFEMLVEGKSTVMVKE